MKATIYIYLYSSIMFGHFYCRVIFTLYQFFFLFSFFQFFFFHTAFDHMRWPYANATWKIEQKRMNSIVCVENECIWIKWHDVEGIILYPLDKKRRREEKKKKNKCINWLSISLRGPTVANWNITLWVWILFTWFSCPHLWIYSRCVCVSFCVWIRRERIFPLNIFQTIHRAKETELSKKKKELK